MRYSYEFKRMCVKLYRLGRYPETPDGVPTQKFRNEIRTWVRMIENNGLEVLHHKPQNKNWTADERLEMVSQVLAGQSYASVAIFIQDNFINGFTNINEWDIVAL